MNIYLHILTFAVLSLIPLVAIAQPVIERVILFPDRSRGTIGRGFDDIFITDDGNYALSGANAADQNFSQWLILSDTEGNMIFQRFVDGNDINQSFNSIIEADNGDLVTAGYEFGHNGGDASVLRTSSEGEILWHRYYGQANNDQFHAVVELKSNELFFAGQSGTLAYVVKTESNGDVIWERRYGRGPASQFWAIRETRDNDILLAGTLNWAAWVLKIDGNGNEIWSNTYGQNGERLQEYFRTLLTVSNDGEYLAAGASRRTDDRTSRAFAVRLASNGREIWQRAYDLGEPGWLNQFNGAAKISSLEYILVGRHGSNLPGGFICKIDNDGDMLWRQLYRPNARPIEVVELRSVLSDREGRILTVGQGSREGAHGGIFLEYMPERSGPRIINFFPAEFELGVLTGEGLEFWVHAIDLQNDSIYYHWQRDMEEIESQDSVAQVNFLEIGDNIVSVVVTDSTGSDSARWLIHVRDLLIFSHTPDTLSLTIQRNSEIDFALDSVAYIGDLENLRYEWMIYDSAAVRWEEVAGDDRIGIRSYA
ncbi:MAG: hypothetical protein FJY67_12000, partial [Calditrichaeota bacterium]|nr:hypothetical protein [Calditrichota bacterium]